LFSQSVLIEYHLEYLHFIQEKMFSHHLKDQNNSTSEYLRVSTVLAIIATLLGLFFYLTAILYILKEFKKPKIPKTNHALQEEPILISTQKEEEHHQTTQRDDPVNGFTTERDTFIIENTPRTASRKGLLSPDNRIIFHKTPTLKAMATRNAGPLSIELSSNIRSSSSDSPDSFSRSPPKKLSTLKYGPGTELKSPTIYKSKKKFLLSSLPTESPSPTKFPKDD